MKRQTPPLAALILLLALVIGPLPQGASTADSRELYRTPRDRSDEALLWPSLDQGAVISSAISEADNGTAMLRHLASVVAATSTYTITEINGLGGNFEVFGLNEAGEVVGQQAGRAFIWRSGVITDLNTLGGDTATAYAINDVGAAAGTSTLSPNSGRSNAFKWQTGQGMSDLGALSAGQGSVAYAINNAGFAAGQSAANVFTLSGLWAVPRAFVSTGGGLLGLGVLPSYNNHYTPGVSYAFGINDSGQVVGEASAEEGERAFRWSDVTGMIELGAPGGKYSVARAINNNGVAVGSVTFPIAPDSFTFFTHAFMWDAFGAPIDLDPTPGAGNSEALAINNSGQVVGRNASGPFLWQRDIGMVSLDMLLPEGSGWQLGTPTGINDAGQIIGVGLYNGQRRAFLLTPQGSVDLYRISGRVADLDGNPIAGVTITDSAGNIMLTDGAGAYTTPSLLGGAYVITPSKEGYTFDPPSRSVSLPPDPGPQNFTAVTYPISGRVTDAQGRPIANTLVYDNNGHSVLTNADGYYMLAGLGKGSYVVTASKGAFVFSPSNHLVTLPPAALDRDFKGEHQYELTAMEVTQAIQDLKNSVALIQDKPTYVRAYVQSRTNTIPNVRAKLVGRRNGVELPHSPLPNANRGGSINIGTIDIKRSPQRDHLDDSFLFELPAEWLSGTIELEFVSEDDNVSCASNLVDCKLQVTFEPSPALDVKLISFVWQEDGTSYFPRSADVLNAISELEALLPIPGVTWNYDYNLSLLSTTRRRPTDDQLSELNSVLATMRALDGCNSTGLPPCGRYYLGLLVNPPQQGTLGKAAGIPSDSATTYLDDDHTLSHEFGHSSGRYHTRCTVSPFDESGPDRAYPYSWGRISEDRSFYGFDTRSSTIYPWDTGDLMSYCSPNWPSDYTYRNIRDHLIKRYGLPTPSPAAPSMAVQQAIAPGDVAVIVSGFITPTAHTAAFASTYVITSSVAAATPEPGPYAIRLEDGQGLSLGDYPFSPAESVEGTSVAFSLFLPWNPNAARIVLLYSGQALASRSASAHRPVVAVLSPNGGETLSGPSETLRWTASDADGDQLTYAIQYSADGGASWRTVATDWLSTTYDLWLDPLPGGDQGLVRILASDGVNTTLAQSEAPFSLARHAPQAAIETPEENRLYVGDQILILNGSAYDSEDGQLGDAALSWQSDLDGTLGSGRSLAIDVSQLSEGQHTITLTAADSDGEISSVSTTIVVARTRPVLPLGLLIAPQTLIFTATLNGEATAPQLVGVRNEGDGELGWTATANQSWLHLDAPSGIAPENIVVTADPTGLVAGDYSAELTVATTTGDISHTVEVSFEVVRPADATAPLLAPHIEGVQGGDGWYTSAVSVTWAVSDAESGVAETNCEPALLVSDTASTTVQCSATNGAGLESSGTVTLKIDRTAPLITITSPLPNRYGLVRNVPLAWSVSDALSGVATVSATLDGALVANNQVIDLYTIGLGTHVLEVVAVDSAGNTVPRSVIFTNSTSRLYLPYAQQR